MAKHLLNNGERYLAPTFFHFAHQRFKTDVSREKIKGTVGELVVLPANLNGLNVRFCLISQKESMILNIFVEGDCVPFFTILSAKVDFDDKVSTVQNKILSARKNDVLSDFFTEFCERYEIPELQLADGSVVDFNRGLLKIA
jgi:hypothetical protein